MRGVPAGGGGRGGEACGCHLQLRPPPLPGQRTQTDQHRGRSQTGLSGLQAQAEAGGLHRRGGGARGGPGEQQQPREHQLQLLVLATAMVQRIECERSTPQLFWHVEGV